MRTVEELWKEWEKESGKWHLDSPEIGLRYFSHEYVAYLEQRVLELEDIIKRAKDEAEENHHGGDDCVACGIECILSEADKGEK